MWSLSTSRSTKMARRVSLLGIGTRLASGAALALDQTTFIGPLSGTGGTLELVLVSAVPEPGTSHSELIGRFGVLSRMSSGLLELFGVGRIGIEFQPSSGLLRIHWHVLIFPSVPWILFSVTGQLGSRSSSALHQIFWLWPLERVSRPFCEIVKIGGSN